MKLLLPPLALFLFSSSLRDEVELSFAPEEGTVLKRVFEARAEYSLSDWTRSVNGEELEREGDLPEDSSGFVEHIAVTDTLGAIENGRPAEVVRTFDELSQSNDGEDPDEGTALVSPLQGRRVRFAWNDEDERYQAEAADEEALDEERAQWLAEDMDLRLVLPSGEVEAGDDWELDPELYLAFMWPSGLLDFHPADQEPSSDEFSRQTIERLEGTGRAKLEELREEDGVRVAVIAIELDITTGSDRVLPEVEEDGELVQPEVTITIEIERELTGTIVWDLEHGHALSAELDCVASRKETSSWSLSAEHEGEEFEAEFEDVRLYEGTIKYSATIERE